MLSFCNLRLAGLKKMHCLALFCVVVLCRSSTHFFAQLRFGGASLNDAELYKTCALVKFDAPPPLPPVALLLLQAKLNKYAVMIRIW